MFVPEEVYEPVVVVLRAWEVTSDTVKKAERGGNDCIKGPEWIAITLACDIFWRLLLFSTDNGNIFRGEYLKRPARSRYFLPALHTNAQRGTQREGHGLFSTPNIGLCVRAAGRADVSVTATFCWSICWERELTNTFATGLQCQLFHYFLKTIFRICTNSTRCGWHHAEIPQQVTSSRHAVRGRWR